MRRFCDHLRYYWERLAKNTNTLMFKVLSALSFLMIAFYFGDIVYYSTMCYDTLKQVFVGGD